MLGIKGRQKKSSTDRYISYSTRSIVIFPVYESWEQALLNVHQAMEPGSSHDYYEPKPVTFADRTITEEPCDESLEPVEATDTVPRSKDSKWGLLFLANLMEVVEARDQYHATLTKFYKFEERFDPNASASELWRRAEESFNDICVDLDKTMYNIK